MADTLTAAQRSALMSRIRGTNTGPERIVRSMLHRLGYRFTVNAPNNRRLPGKPDLVLPRYRTVVFVHGCFWHGHEGCKVAKIPKTRRAWWRAKIEGNRRRDARSEEALRTAGWHVMMIWECAVRTVAARQWLEARLPKLLGPPPARPTSPIRYSLNEPAPTLRAAEEVGR